MITVCKLLDLRCKYIILKSGENWTHLSHPLQIYLLIIRNLRIIKTLVYLHEHIIILFLFWWRSSVFPNKHIYNKSQLQDKCKTLPVIFFLSYSKLKRMQTTWLSCNDVCYLYITTTSTDIEFSRFLKPNKNSPKYYWLHYKNVFLVCGSVRIYDQLKMIPSQNIQVLVCLAAH